MDKTKSNLDFRLMALTYKFRDFFSPRMNILKEAGIKPGFTILDYGCGPGSYIVPVAELVGKSGKIHALDIHPLAIKSTKSIIAKKRLANVETIQSDCKTGLPDTSVDVVLLYDIFHDLDDTNCVLAELHRILKQEGILSFSDHHLKENEVMSGVTRNGLFKLLRKGPTTYSFRK
jgi:ubiquinone/menaquinone biosynthesis C-methylase UbiE